MTNPPSQNRPVDPNDAPKPHHAYERAEPEAEAGMGDLDKDEHTPCDRTDDRQSSAGAYQPDGTRLKTDCDGNLGRPDQPVARQEEIEGDMTTEEPLGWDQAPQSIPDPEQKRHPRPDGVGGVKERKDKDKG